MLASPSAPRCLAVLVACSALAASSRADDPKAYTDPRYDFSIEVPAPWAEAGLGTFTVPGVIRAAWTGPADASIVAFVQEPGSAFSPRFLVDESAKAMKEKLGCQVGAAEVREVAGKQAMWMVVTGKGTGGALTGQGDVQTTSHWVAIPREKDLVIVLLTSPAGDYAGRLPSFEKALKSLKVGGKQTPEQAEAR